MGVVDGDGPSRRIFFLLLLLLKIIGEGRVKI